jgi:hypothetical protein
VFVCASKASILVSKCTSKASMLAKQILTPILDMQVMPDPPTLTRLLLHAYSYTATDAYFELLYSRGSRLHEEDAAQVGAVGVHWWSGAPLRHRPDPYGGGRS